MGTKVGVVVTARGDKFAQDVLGCKDMPGEADLSTLAWVDGVLFIDVYFAQFEVNNLQMIPVEDCDGLEIPEEQRANAPVIDTD